jgi:Domain of unknown function (DUF4326)
MTTIVNIKKAELQKRNIKDFEQWNMKPNTLYIGRDITVYVKGTTKSKWANPYNAKKYGRDECLKMYEKYIRESLLYNQLNELKNKELGCWCKPEACHGDILIKLLRERS